MSFGIGTMLANFHMCGIMFNLSGPCELLFLLCFIASWTRVVVSVMLYPCSLCVVLLVLVCLV